MTSIVRKATKMDRQAEQWVSKDFARDSSRIAGLQWFYKISFSLETWYMGYNNFGGNTYFVWRQWVAPAFCDASCDFCRLRYHCRHFHFDIDRVARVDGTSRWTSLSSVWCHSSVGRRDSEGHRTPHTRHHRHRLDSSSNEHIQYIIHKSNKGRQKNTSLINNQNGCSSDSIVPILTAPSWSVVATDSHARCAAFAAITVITGWWLTCHDTNEYCFTFLRPSHWPYHTPGNYSLTKSSWNVVDQHLADRKQLYQPHSPERMFLLDIM